MNKKIKYSKIIAAFQLIVVLLVIAGCAPGTNTSISNVNLKEGTEGLVLKFMDRAPPNEVQPGQKFQMIVELTNKGSYDIKRGVLVLGLEKNYIATTQEFEDQPVYFDLEGRTLYNPIGGMYRKTIPLNAGALGSQQETQTTNIAVTACYPYKTQTTAQVCIDTDIYGEKQIQKACIAETISMGTVKSKDAEVPKGQGSPIAITRVEQKMLSHENDELITPEFVIHIANVGGGIPTSAKAYEDACRASGPDSKMWNVVDARVYLSDKSAQLDCTPKLVSASQDKAGYIKLSKKEEENTVRCRLKEGISKTKGTYTAPLLVELDYGYTFTVSKSVLIKK